MKWNRGLQFTHTQTADHLQTMDHCSCYYCAVAVNCITIVHLCLHRIDKHQDRYLFLTVVALTIARLAMDIIFQHMHADYLAILGFFMVLEFILLDCVVRKMQKLASSQPIVIFFLTLCMLFADISYGLHLSKLMTEETTQTVPD